MYTYNVMYEILLRLSSLNPCCVLDLMEDSLASVILPPKMIKMIIIHMKLSFVAFYCPVIFL